MIPEGDESARRLIDCGGALYEENHIAIRYEKRDLAVWDNWRMPHSRNAFEDPQRHIERVQIAG
ncbi:TauD/TfdA family dioxygenase [Streptomyces sp. NPDC018026]|uniref:TauD/TfdA family dioxygenase n=1 Tax=Streptomyces sp. NPDC018026 TaxID=3365031 RepID=UPI0037ACB875